MRLNKYATEIEMLLNLYHVLRESGEPTCDASRRLTLEQRVQIVHDVRKALEFAKLSPYVEFSELNTVGYRRLSAVLISRQMLPLRVYLSGRPGGVA